MEGFELNTKELAVLLDVVACLAIYTFAKAFDKDEIEAILGGLPERLKAQGFESDMVEKVIDSIKKPILMFKGEGQEGWCEKK